MNKSESIELIPLWALEPSRFQPRDAHFGAEALVELAQSIKANGLINPVLVFGYDDAEGYIVWELIAGERRARACTALKLAELFPQHSLEDWVARLAEVGLAGMGDEERKALCQAQAHIPATIHAGKDLQAIHLLAVVENLDRQALNPLEEARAYQGLMQAYQWTQRELAAHVNKSQGYVAQRLGLLSLNAEAAHALNTRVIGMAHARALAAVPVALQQVATEYVIDEVQKDESPATTRQIENQLRALAAFVDPARWEPNGERAYTPHARNRLAVIKMLVSGPHAVERIAKGWGHLRSFDLSYEKKNLLTAKPLTVVENQQMYAGITNALGLRPQDAWQQHAHVENKRCTNCIFATAWRPLTPGLSAHCPRWKKGEEDLKTCEGWISNDFGPVVIPVTEYYVREQMKDSVYLVHEPFAHTDSLEAYLEAYQAATDLLITRQAEKEDKETNGPRRQIQEFFEWQNTLPGEHLRHSQAHACVVCRYFEPMHRDAPCRFATNPLTTRWGDAPRAPEMGMLCSPTLMLLPRCEMFSRRQPPTIYQQPGFNVGTGKRARQNLLTWMHTIKKSAGSLSYYARFYLWRGIFAWLYPDGDGQSYSWDDIESYLAKNWETVGDGGMATLLTALVLETKAASTYKGVIELLDLTTGDAEAWMPIAFSTRREEQKDWPESWLRPWMMKTLAEVFTAE